MTVTPRAFGPTNTFIPSATGQVIGYIKKPGQFKLFDYVQTVGSNDTDSQGKPICAYAILDPNVGVRTGPSSGPTVTDPTIAGTNAPSVDGQWRWAPGQDRPKGNILPKFEWKLVEMIRRAYSYDFDDQTDASADLPVASIYREAAAGVAMTVKTHRVIKLLETAANWPTTSVADATVLNGGKGKWGLASSDELSPNFASIRLSVAQAAINIVQATNGAVRPEDLRIIISPNVAMKLGTTGEIYNYVKYGSFSKDRQEGKNQLNEQYLMPKYYAGVEWVIEDATFDATEAIAAGTYGISGFIKNDTTAVMVSRKGGLNGVYGSPSFSTVQVFYYKFEMAVEEMHDTWNKKKLGSVVDQYAEVLAATRAGFLIQNIL